MSLSWVNFCEIWGWGRQEKHLLDFVASDLDPEFIFGCFREWKQCAVLFIIHRISHYCNMQHTYSCMWMYLNSS